MTRCLPFSPVRATTTWSDPEGDSHTNLTPPSSTTAMTPRTFAAVVKEPLRSIRRRPLLPSVWRRGGALRLLPEVDGATDCLSPVAVAFGVAGRPSSRTGRNGGSFRPRKPPDAAPAAKIRADRTAVLFQRAVDDRRAGTGGLWITGVLGRAVGARAGARASLGRLCGSGRSTRARAASTGSMSASSGLIGPRSDSSPGTAPSGRNSASVESRTTSDPRLTAALLQALGLFLGSTSEWMSQIGPRVLRTTPDRATKNTLFPRDYAAPAVRERGFVRSMR